MTPVDTIADLTSRFANNGTLEWIGIRPERRKPMEVLENARLSLNGLAGDHNQSGGKRTVTLVQHEHLAVIASILGLQKIRPDQLRRNLVISGINLLGLRNRKFWLGNAVLEGTGLCAPCSRMEEEFGHGGYAAVRGHGGITARVISQGTVSIGDSLVPEKAISLCK